MFLSNSGSGMSRSVTVFWPARVLTFLLLEGPLGLLHVEGLVA